MNILITNDDGYSAPGIQALIKALVKYTDHNLYILAPKEHMSAKSHSLTAYGELELNSFEFEGTKASNNLSGTPVDCVKFALHMLYKDVKFDLCLSGINNGCNTDRDVNYSGTFAGAHEAFMNGVNSISLSLSNSNALKLSTKDFEPAASHIANWLSEVPVFKTPYFYNINYPLGVKDIELEVSFNIYTTFSLSYEFFKNVRDNVYVYDSLPRSKTFLQGSEEYFVDKNKASITAIKVDYNDYDTLKLLKHTIESSKKHSNSNIQIAIDGTSASGKSSLAKLLSAKLGYFYLDTGAMYRALTYFCLENNINIENINDTNELNKIFTQFKNSFDLKTLSLNKKSIKNEIRTPKINENTSKISQIPTFRKLMIKLQQEISKNKNVIAEGRDTTTAVFPNAKVKIFLNASLQERAKRRQRQDKKRGIDLDIDYYIKTLEERDYKDTKLEHSPMKNIPKSALTIDTTNKTLEETASELEQIIHKL